MDLRQGVLTRHQVKVITNTYSPSLNLSHIIATLAIMQRSTQWLDLNTLIHSPMLFQVVSRLQAFLLKLSITSWG